MSLFLNLVELSNYDRSAMRHDLAIIHRNSMPEAFLLEYMLLPSRIHRQPKFHQHGHECLLISSDPQSPAWAKLVRSKLKYLYEQLLPMIERLSKERFWILQALLLLYTGWIFSVHCAISTAQNWKSQLSVASYVRMLYSAKALHESKSDFLVSAKRKKIIIQLTLQSQTVPS